MSQKQLILILGIWLSALTSCKLQPLPALPGPGEIAPLPPVPLGEAIPFGPPIPELATSAPAVGENVHITKNGETLSVIAKKWGVTVAALRAANPNLGSGNLRVGLRLKFPSNTLPPGPKTLAEFVTGKTLLLIRGDTNPVEHFHFTFTEEATVLNGLGEEAPYRVSSLTMGIFPSEGEQEIRLLFPAPILNIGDTIKLSRENKVTDQEELVVTEILIRDESSPLATERDGFSSAGYFYQQILRQLKQPNRIWTQSDFGRVSELSESLTENDRSVDYPFTNLKALTRFHNLEKLGIEWSALTDLSPLVGFPKLRELEINVHEAKSLAPLAQLKQLRSLHLLNDNPTRPQAEIAELKDALPKCTIKREIGKQKKVRPILSEAEESAGIINAAIRKALSKPFGKLTPSDLQGITSLDLARLDLTHLDTLGKLTHLKKLDLGENIISNLTPLRSLNRLEWLRLNGNQINDLSPLSGLKSLKAVYLHKYPLSDLTPLIGIHTHMADKLNGNPALTAKQVARLQKELPGCLIVFNRPTSPAVGKKAEAIIEAAIRHAIDKPTGNLTDGDFEKVKKLMLVCENLADISALSKLKNLKVLNLYGNQISDLRPLIGLKKLTLLDLRINRVDDLAPLAGLANLKTLRLKNNRVSDVSPLEKLAKLESLDLANNRVNQLIPGRGKDRDWSGPTPFPNLRFVQLGDNSNAEDFDVWKLLSIRPKLSIDYGLSEYEEDYWSGFGISSPELPVGDIQVHTNNLSNIAQNVWLPPSSWEYWVIGVSFPILIGGAPQETLRSANDWLVKHFRKIAAIDEGPFNHYAYRGVPGPPDHVYDAYMHKPTGNVFSTTVTDQPVSFCGAPRTRQNGINLWLKSDRVKEILLPDLFKPSSGWEKAVVQLIHKEANKLYRKVEQEWAADSPNDPSPIKPFILETVPRNVAKYYGKFWITSEGLGFHFRPSADWRGIWCCGINVTVPMKSLQPYLRKDGPLGHLAKNPE